MFSPNTRCENCPDEEVELIPLRFVGGRSAAGKRGPYLAYDTGKIYMMKPGYANLPWWQSPDGETDEPKEGAEQDFKYTDKEVPNKPSRGLVRGFGSSPQTEEDFLYGMDDATLKHYIESNGGKIDGRWGRESLIREAKKLQ